MSLEMLSDALLFESYQKALKIRLQEDFLEILRTEITRRGIDISLEEEKNSLVKSSN